jgi:hypothetical protein
MTLKITAMRPKHSDSRARQAARKAGLRCVKSRQQEHINQRGGYQLLDESANVVVAGLDFDLSADEVVAIALDEMQKDHRRG